VTDGVDWLPPLLLFEDYKGEWETYIKAVYQKFREDIINSKIILNGRRVECRCDPILDGKEAGFWHCVSEGKDEKNRLPDLRRCERIGWIRAILEHITDEGIETWIRLQGDERRLHVWLQETYLVVLSERKEHWQLITAFCTDYEHTKRNKRKERDSYKKLKPPP
jgi:hypothetical protein